MNANRSQHSEINQTSEESLSHIDQVNRIESDELKRVAAFSNSGLLGTSIISKAAVISPRTLYFEALAHCLNNEFDVMYGVFGTLNSFMAAMHDKDLSGVILILMENCLWRTYEEIGVVVNELIDPSIVIIGNDSKYDKIDHIQKNVKAIIPINSTLIVALQAIRLVQYGGVFFPRNNLEDKNDRQDVCQDHDGVLEGLTRTQLEVAKALRSGKSNKLIAHHLGMNEHTVKVHIRNILKRLGARNRTEAALIISRNQSQ